MTVMYFFAAIILVSAFSATVAAGAIVQTPLLEILGPFSTGLVGVAGCFLLAGALLFVLDPDPVSGLDGALPRLMRTLPITGLSAILWLPIYVSLFNRRRRVRAAK